MPSFKPFDITLGDINFLLDQMRDAIEIVRYDANGQPVYGYADSAGTSHELGLFGTFDPLAVTDAVTGASIYDGAREASGFRIPVGFFNNLVDLTRWTWGATDNPFPRLTEADYHNYIAQVMTNPALTNSNNTGYLDTHTLSSTTVLAETGAGGDTTYGDLNKTIVDYTPRMITQTVSSSYGAPGPAMAVGITAAGTSAAIATMSPGELLIVSTAGGLVAFSFYNGDQTLDPSTGNLVGIDVRPSMTVADALLAMQNALRTVGGMTGATVGLDSGDHIVMAAGAPTDGSIAVFDYAGLGLGGAYDPSVDNTNSALIRTGAYTDVFVSENVIGISGGELVEYVSRNLNTLPGDPSTSGIFTLFGQFFDHGLDFINKGGQGSKIIIPLAPNDPLYRAPDLAHGDPGNTTITISRATPEGYTVDDYHGRPMSIAGADNVWSTGDDLASAGADGQWGTADDEFLGGADKNLATTGDNFSGTPISKPETTTYTNHTSPYIDQSQSYGSDTQTTYVLREWVEDPNNPGHFIPGAELLDGHVTQAYHSTTFDDASAGGLNPTGELADGTTTRTLPTLNELREHMRHTGRDDLTWDDINNLRARDDAGKVIDTNGEATAGGYVYTGEALLLDINPRFDIGRLHPNDNNAATDWDANEGSKVDAAIAALNSYMTTNNLGTFGVVNNELTLTLTSTQVTGMGPLPAGTYTGAYAMALWVNFANFNITAPDSIYDHVGQIMMASIGDHYVAGDGRANENFGLTAIHHVFHANHNVQLVNLEKMVLSAPDEAARHGYMTAVATKVGDVVASGITVVDGHYEDANHNYTDAAGNISRNQDKMFEGAKLINEMEYQHVAIDQYARLVTPDLPEFVTYDNDIQSDISLEYSQAAFRFGHSQLRETIDTIDPNGIVTKWALEAAFLNPDAYAATGAENILRGMSQQLSNEVDEFVTPAMQQTLLGQPLDLAAINIARGRDVGMPTLNEVRKQLHDALVAERAADPATPHHTNLIVDALNPYTSWAEFGSQMQHPESLVNFLAAYGFDGNLEKASAIIGLEDGSIAAGDSAAMGYTIGDAIGVLNHSYSGADAELQTAAGAFNDIDFWLGGLAELHVFTGQLGTTFNAIFEDQMERLMDGDRFYYLYRLGLALPIDPDIGHAVVTEQFKDIIERTTGALHLNGDVMGWADHTFELAPMYQAALDAHAADANGTDAFSVNANIGLGIYSGAGNGTAGNGTILTKSNSDLGITRQYIADFRPDTGENPDGTPSSGYNSHEVFAGTDYDDWLDAGNGDDTIYGDKGDDVLDGKAGADHIYGGDGQDVIYGGDIEDFLDGGAGDDIIYAGTSAGVLDVVIGGHGNDKLYGEAGIDEIYGGEGDDYIDAGGDTDLAFGDAGNDIMFGGDGPDELRGGEGDDMLSGGSGSDQLKGEHGDDIFFGGIGQAAQTGDSDEALGDTGFDIAAFSDTSIALDTAADLRNVNLTGAPGGSPFEPFNQLWTDLEGVIGSKFNDSIIGADPGTVDAEGVNPGDNWLIGGGGDDTFGTRTADANGSLGGGGNDVIIGDGIRLDTLIGAYGGYTDGFDANGNATHGYSGTLSEGLLGNAGLGTEMFAKHFTELLKTEARKDLVLGDDPGVDGSNDVAIFTGNRADYTVDVITFNSPNEGTVTAYKVTDNRDPTATDANGVLVPTDGTDLVVGVDVLRFVDGDIHLPLIAPSLDLHAYNITTGNYADNLNTAAFNNSTGATPWTTPWSETGDSTVGNVVTGGQIQIDAGGGGGTNQLRILDNGDGASIQRAVNLSGYSSATLTFSYSESSFDTNEQVVASFSFDSGTTWHQLATFNTNTNGGGTFSQNLQALLGPGESFGPNGIVKFEAFTANGGNGYIAIDNVNVALVNQTPVNDGTNDYSATFTEGGPSVGIASGPGITDDGSVIYSAKVVLNNAKPGDTLSRNDINGDGITGTTDTSVPGQITVNLTGASSFAAYQAAIQAITFSNNSQNPDQTDRIIQVTVKDELINSNVATATIHVMAVNDPPNAGNDSIITNYVNGSNNISFDVPDWALLANDADPDSPSLSITAVTEGETNFSVAHTAAAPAHVTVTKSNTSPHQFTATVSDGAASDTANVTVSTDTTGTLDGTSGNNIIVGDGGNTTIDGGTGDDIIFAGPGNDTIIWNANTFGSTDGRDFVDGSAGTADTFVVNGRNGAESFAIYSNTDDWDNNAANGIVSSAAHAGLTGLNASTEIVVTRNGAIIAELDNIEEITVNTLNVSANDGNGVLNGGATGGDTVTVVGDFTGTSLNYSTITVNGGNGDDTVDITGLTSDHRIVFHGGDGNNQVLGNLRAQDVVDNQNGSAGDGTQGDPSGGDDHDDDNDNHGLTLAHLGTAGDDVMIGTSDDDVLSGGDGDDLILGYDGADTLKGGAGDDLVKGGAGGDVVFGDGGNDDIFGGSGQDLLLGDAGDDRLFGDAGDDVLEGGAGNDTVYGGAGNDRVLAKVGDGDDIYWGETDEDTLDYSAIGANVTADLGNGLMQHGSVSSSQSGSDQVFGFENFIGGSGNDTIVASAAKNAMDGGGGNDTFVFHSAADGDGDTINGFQPGDKIDLSGIDADTGASGKQSFVLFAGNVFTAAGQVIITQEVKDGVEHTFVSGNTNSDTAADFKIDVGTGNQTLTSADFNGVH
jgi:Ca2+-binding RTX toxin-like protein